MLSPLSWISRAWYRHMERRDLGFDRRFGLDTCPPDLGAATNQVSESDRPHALEYHATPTGLFWRIVRRSRVNPRKFAFIDLGVGKGRTLLLASELGFDPVVGVEIDPRLCRVAEDNIRTWGDRGRVVPIIIEEDARTVPLPPGNLFVYLFNPFTGPMFESVAARLADAAGEAGRAVVVAYNNDPCSSVLVKTGAFRRVRMKPIRFWRPPTVSFFYNDRAWRMRKDR